MDRGRHRNRSRDLLVLAEQLEQLAKMPDRATSNDLRRAADLMRSASGDITELVDARLPGCTCRRIETDNYSYLDYAPGCLHHRGLHLIREHLKENYEKMERRLMDEARMRLVVAALSGAASNSSSSDMVADIVARAIALADEAARQIIHEPVRDEAAARSTS